VIRFPRTLSIHQKWIGFFGVWLFILSGISTGFLGSPGIIQAIRLSSLLRVKKEALAMSLKETRNLEFDVNQLEKNRYVQQREIRRILGYAASDEIVFDFSTANNKPHK
jgi:cell division protein FtsB